jgi:hypothetical protein
MNVFSRRRLFLVMVLAASLPCGAEEPAASSKEPAKPLTEAEFLARTKDLHPGLSPTEVTQLLGAQPRKKARQILFQRSLEQWIYEYPTFVLRLDFDFPRGQQPRLLTVHLHPPSRP